MSVSELEKINIACEYLKSNAPFIPKIGVVLGSGLGGFVQKVKVAKEIKYESVPHFCVSTTPFHDGKMIFGYLDGMEVLLFSGRVHLYEGYDAHSVVRFVRVASLLGVEKFILTNSAGGINAEYKVGDIVTISDHISSFVPSPINSSIRRRIGEKKDFPDMSEVYDKNLRGVVKSACEELGCTYKEGVYIQVPGAQYETPAEIRFYSKIGADIVGMSTVIEAMALRHMGAKVLGLSLVTNMAAGMSERMLSHEEVKQSADNAGEKFSLILSKVIKNID